MANVTLPNNWNARPHQTSFGKALLQDGIKRAVAVWHRRAGKDSASLNFTAVAAHQKVATYWHMLPTAIQARHVVWDAIDPHTGVRIIDQVWPKELRKSINNTEMKIELKNGSIWQCVGSDNYDRLVGSNPFGIVFSEYSIADPRAWDFIRPILAENGGWAVFIYTPRGKNHGYALFEMAKNNPEWFAEILTIDDSQRNDGSPVVTREMYEAEINAGMDPLLAKQEFYCSFDAGLFGAYYTHEMSLAKYGSYPWNPGKPVHTFWDIGLSDSTAIWFGQQSADGDSINIIDYEQENNVPFSRWIKELKEKPYTYGVNSKPHDFKKRDWKDGKSAINTAHDFDWNYELTPNIPRNQGIDSVKMFLPRLCFNTDNPQVNKGIDALTNYRREFNDKLKVFMDRPLHDWASNGADAMRYMSIAWPDDYSSTSNRRFGVIPAIKSPSRQRNTPRIARSNRWNQ